MMVETKDIISGLAIIVSAGIAVFGWFKAARKDRNHHLFQKRVERRIAMLDDVIAAVTPLLNHASPFTADPDLAEKLAKARLSVQLYGYDDEVRDYEELIRGIEQSDVVATQNVLSVLVPRIRFQIRREMGYST